MIRTVRHNFPPKIVRGRYLTGARIDQLNNFDDRYESKLGRFIGKPLAI